MFPFTPKANKTEDASAQDRMVWRLLDAPCNERQLLLLTALRDGELGMREAADVLLTVERIESLSLPVHPDWLPETGETEPYWQQTGRRFIF